MRHFIEHSAFISGMEPKSVVDALNDPSWIEAMQKEFHQFIRNDACELIEKHTDIKVIGTYWISKKKLDVSGRIVKNNIRLIAQSYNQEEGIEFNEFFPPIAWIEDIRVLLAYVSYKNIKHF